MRGAQRARQQARPPEKEVARYGARAAARRGKSAAQPWRAARESMCPPACAAQVQECFLQALHIFYPPLRAGFGFAEIWQQEEHTPASVKKNGDKIKRQGAMCGIR